MLLFICLFLKTLVLFTPICFSFVHFDCPCHNICICFFNYHNRAIILQDLEFWNLEDSRNLKMYLHSVFSIISIFFLISFLELICYIKNQHSFLNNYPVVLLVIFFMCSGVETDISSTWVYFWIRHRHGSNSQTCQVYFWPIKWGWRYLSYSILNGVSGLLLHHNLSWTYIGNYILVYKIFIASLWNFQVNNLPLHWRKTCP